MSTKKEKNSVQNTDAEDFSFLQSLTDDELDDLLDTAADEGGPNETGEMLICAVLDEFGRRGDTAPAPDERETEAAFERFKARLRAEGEAKDTEEAEKTHKPVSEQGTRRLRRGFLAAAACLLLIFVVSFGFSLSASADGHDFWDKLASWTKETFLFGDEEKASQEEPNVQIRVFSLFADLDMVLKENSMDVLLPSWAPKGYEAKDVMVNDDGDTKIVEGWFQNVQNWFSIQVVRKDDGFWTQSNFEENQGGGEIYVFGKAEHYISANEMDGLVRYNAVWQQGDYIIKLQGNLTKEEIRRMIDSVYERV